MPMAWPRPTPPWEPHLSGDTITSMVIDAVQANVNFNAAGTITTDLSAAQPSKNELGADYGMGKVSSIGKEWDEQAAAFASYVTGKTVAEATGIAVTEEGNAAMPISPPPSPSAWATS